MLPNNNEVDLSKTKNIIDLIREASLLGAPNFSFCGRKCNFVVHCIAKVELTMLTLSLNFSFWSIFSLKDDPSFIFFAFFCS